MLPWGVALRPCRCSSSPRPLGTPSPAVADIALTPSLRLQMQSLSGDICIASQLRTLTERCNLDFLTIECCLRALLLGFLLGGHVAPLSDCCWADGQEELATAASGDFKSLRQRLQRSDAANADLEQVPASRHPADLHISHRLYTSTQSAS